MTPSDDEQRSLKRSKASLVERVAERLAQESQTSSEESVSETQTTSAQRLMGEAEQSPSRARTPTVSRQVGLDFAHMRSIGLITPGQARNHLAEEMRLIKYQVLLNTNNTGLSNPNIVMVTSANPGEGKTFTAINLAMSLAAEHDKYVLLVDADVARPRVFEHLGIEPQAGLLDLLKDPKLDLSEVILRTDIERLSLIGPGAADDFSVELFNSDRMRRVTSELAQRYADRVIIFDTPPVLATVEPTVLSNLAGQALFVIQANRTKRRDVETAVELLREDCELGFVLNRGSGLAASNYTYYTSYYRSR